ncbi:pantetheine-phosphate adenylyltransferase family protein [Talaromyces marneffei ATCC 18224]|uniref:Pantetheine-phosphate adenylyltransferase family protein n=3 Tax=Talaromyces marneffei TaxID=37727 RepID=B6QLD6_TALMQ|nr:pantetheine-phosphate adenylyltransferase family protein [Talaromyces marneffei ATCC 18224]
MAALHSLLLLPAPPSPAVRQLKEVYGPALSHLFSSIAAQLKGSSDIYKLDVALVIPQLLSTQYHPRSKAFASIQKLLANFYTLVGAISAENDVELDAPGGIDVRVFFVDNTEYEQAENWKRIQGPIIDFRTLATSQRPWDHVYVPSTTEGELLGAALSTHGVSIANTKLPVGTTSSAVETIISSDEERSTSHAAVIVGGTFDHLHLGHKLLLTATALTLDVTRDKKVLAVGITGDQMLVNKKFAEYLESWEERMQGTASFLRAIVDFNPPETSSADLTRTEQPGPNGKQVSFQVAPDTTVRLVQIDDPFGPTITEEQFSALIVSAETRSGGQAVNTERNKKGWASLEVFEVGVLQAGEAQEVADTSASSFESKISSTDIRQRRMKSAASNL